VHLHPAAPSLRARVRPAAWLASIAIAAVLAAGAPGAQAAGVADLRHTPGRLG
jgi:hypothetical protein